MEIDQADSHTSSVTTTTTRRINLVKTPMLWDTHSEGKVKHARQLGTNRTTRVEISNLLRFGFSGDNVGYFSHI